MHDERKIVVFFSDHAREVKKVLQPPQISNFSQMLNGLPGCARQFFVTIDYLLIKSLICWMAAHTQAAHMLENGFTDFEHFHMSESKSGCKLLESETTILEYHMQRYENRLHSVPAVTIEICWPAVNVVTLSVIGFWFLKSKHCFEAPWERKEMKRMSKFLKFLVQLLSPVLVLMRLVQTKVAAV